ncbi:MAG: hypothetical protein ABJA81_09660, partial [Nocardioidaceae bacterium]
MIERDKMLEARGLDRPSERADNNGVGADVGLGKDDTELHRESTFVAAGAPALAQSAWLASYGGRGVRH